MTLPRIAVALSLTVVLAGPAPAATLGGSKPSAVTNTAKTPAPVASTVASTSPLSGATLKAGPVAAGSLSAGAVRKPVRALYGELDAFRSWVDAEERALVAALRVRRHAAGSGVDLLDLTGAGAASLEADAAWMDGLASYDSGAAGSGETLVFVRLHERIALRLFMQLMRPQLHWTGQSVSAEGMDPVSARWLSEAFHAAVRGDAPALNLHVRMLRERLGFALGDQRSRIFSRVLAALDRLDGELADVGLAAGDAFVDAMLPGLGAIAYGDPCAPGASTPLPGGSAVSSVAPTREDLERLDRLGVAMKDLQDQAQFDCDVASGGGANAGGTGGYGAVGDAMGCLGEIFGDTEEPTDYGMCVAAGLGAGAPEEIGAGQLDRARGCSNPLTDGGGKYDPFDLGKWYREKFMEEELRRGESPLPQTPEDEDQKRRDEINEYYDDSTVIKADVGLIEKVVGAIVKAVKAIVEWVSELFSSKDEPAPAPEPEPSEPESQKEPAEEAEPEAPEPPEEQSGTTMPGPDGVGGSGCVDPLVQLAEDCMDRVLSQVPGYRGKELLKGEPGRPNPIVAYPWDGPDMAADLQGCGGSMPTSGVGCEQLTDPPTACTDPIVSSAARYFAEQALRDRFCSLALCSPDLPCECTDGPPPSPPSPPGNPGDPAGPMGPVDPLGFGPTLDLGGSSGAPLDVRAGPRTGIIGPESMMQRP
jgi:hypothetical protein